ncbi:JNK1/MAPK8-associated membrane protein, partial [Nibea albiflora]
LTILLLSCWIFGFLFQNNREDQFKEEFWGTVHYGAIETLYVSEHDFQEYYQRPKNLHGDGPCPCPLGHLLVLMDQLLTCSRSLGQSGILLTHADLSRCMRPSVQPAATRVISPLGSDVILRCDATGYPTPTLTWIKPQATLVSNSGSLSVMQESPRVGVRWSIISLNGLSYKDAGEYRCQARNMAGTSEAPIKLKVVGVSQLSRLPKRKLQKTPKPSTKHRKSNQTTTTIATPSVKENQILQSITPPSINKTQTAPNLESHVFPVHKRRKMNSTNAKKKTKTSIKFASES